MCIIIDTNMFGKFIDQSNADMAPIHKWLIGSGKLVYTTFGKFGEEIKNHQKMQEFFENYFRANKAKRIEEAEIESAMAELENQNLASDDKHIIALAIASNTKLLCSADAKLHKDFRAVIRGKVYQNQTHKRLLAGKVCP